MVGGGTSSWRIQDSAPRSHASMRVAPTGGAAASAMALCWPAWAGSRHCRCARPHTSPAAQFSSQTASAPLSPHGPSSRGCRDSGHTEDAPGRQLCPRPSELRPGGPRVGPAPHPEARSPLAAAGGSAPAWLAPATQCRLFIGQPGRPRPHSVLRGFVRARQVCAPADRCECPPQAGAQQPAGVASCHCPARSLTSQRAETRSRARTRSCQQVY